MAERYSYNRNEDFNEEDVWAVANSKPKLRSSPMDSSPVSSLRRIPTASKMIPRASINEQPKMLQQSAPVNIPDWSKLHKKNSQRGSFGSRGIDDDVNENRAMDDDESDGDDEWVPPHEWIAKKLARTQISSFSVCEGAGRTLKGKDISKVRNAVLTRTGFLE
ncbi:hypothetical protein ACHQM5_004010 [Ranunculus cassubicifolius]